MPAGAQEAEPASPLLPSDPFTPEILPQSLEPKPAGEGEATTGSDSPPPEPAPIPAVPNIVQEEQIEPALPPPPLPFYRTTQLIDQVSDRGVAAFDATSFGRRGSYPSLTPSSPPVTPAGSARPFNFHGSVRVGATAESGNESSIDSEKDAWQSRTDASITVGATFGSQPTGRYLDADYAASFPLSGDSDSEGALDQALTLTGHLGFSKLQLDLAGDYSHSTGPDRDLGESADRDLISVTLNASYPLSVKTGVSGSVSHSSSQYGAGIGSQDLNASLSLNRQISVKTSLGVSATAGTLTVDDAAEQTFSQFNLLASYRPSVKLGLSASVGYEWRDAGGEVSATPVFNGTLSYSLRPNTELSLSASRSVTNSAAEAATNYTSTTFQASVSQKIGLRFSANLALGYQNAIYDGVGDSSDSTQSSREDNYYFIRPDLQMRVTDSFSVSLSYSYGTNRSNERSFVTEQVSLSGNYAF